jgi:hypothetical protein
MFLKYRCDLNEKRVLICWLKLWQLNCSARNEQYKIVGVNVIFFDRNLYLVRNYVRK